MLWSVKATHRNEDSERQNRLMREGKNEREDQHRVAYTMNRQR